MAPFISIKPIEDTTVRVALSALSIVYCEPLEEDHTKDYTQPEMNIQHDKHTHGV